MRRCVYRRMFCLKTYESDYINFPIFIAGDWAYNKIYSLEPEPQIIIVKALSIFHMNPHYRNI